MDGRTKSALTRFAALPPNERWLFVRAMWMLALMALAPRFLSWQTVQHWVEQRNRRLSSKKCGARTGSRTVTRIVFAATRYGFVRGNCLSRSLALCYLLRQEGHDARLRLGGRREAKSFEAHAWVELDGQAVDNRDDTCSSFVPFPVHLNSEFKIQR